VGAPSIDKKKKQVKINLHFIRCVKPAMLASNL